MLVGTLREYQERCACCGNTGKRSTGARVCPYDAGSWVYCGCPIGQAVERVESTLINAEDMPDAVRAAIAAGVADINLIQIPRYSNRPEINAELDGILAEAAEHGARPPEEDLSANPNPTGKSQSERCKCTD